MKKLLQLYKTLGYENFMKLLSTPGHTVTVDYDTEEKAKDNFNMLVNALKGDNFEIELDFCNQEASFNIENDDESFTITFFDNNQVAHIVLTWELFRELTRVMDDVWAENHTVDTVLNDVRKLIKKVAYTERTDISDKLYEILAIDNGEENLK